MKYQLEAILRAEQYLETIERVISINCQYIVEKVMVHNFFSNDPSDHKQQIQIFWLLIGYLHRLFCKLNYGNLKIL